MEFKRRFYFETFGYNVQIILTDDLSAVGARMAEQYSIHNPVGKYTAGFSLNVGGQPVSVLALPLEKDWSVVAHESFHIVWHLMEWIGAQHEEEVMAYCLDTVVIWVGATYDLLDKKQKVVYTEKDDRNSGREVVAD